MFTGIIKYIKKINKNNNIITLELNEQFFEGQYICINGCRLQVSTVNENNCSFIISPEIEKTSCFKQICNIELFNCLIDSGDIIENEYNITGNIDTIGLIKNKTETELEIIFDSKYYDLLLGKTRVAIDGVSLIINKLYDYYFTVKIYDSIINNTIIKFYIIGDIINIEFYNCIIV